MARVSIHAPVKGATRQILQVVAVPGVSIHAPVRGATHNSIAELATDLFQSTRP